MRGVYRAWMTEDQLSVFYSTRSIVNSLIQDSIAGLNRFRKKESRAKRNDSDRGNRTPGCRVRDGDVHHYTISDGDG